MTIDEMIALLQAAKAGKTIESRERDGNAEWYHIPNPRWDFSRREYRVKPEPRTIWLRDFEVPRGVAYYIRVSGTREQATQPGEECKLVKFVEVLE